jgi:hypothetical protein
MAIFLDENMMGADPDAVAFPHLLVCMGVVCVTNDRLFGIHLTTVREAKAVMPAFATWLRDQGVKGDAIRTVYGAANLEVRYGDGSVATLRDQWEKEMAQIAGVLGFSGKAYGFDASVITPKDGFYARFEAEHTTHTCKIFYKRNEKMFYLASDRYYFNLLRVKPGETMPAFVRSDGVEVPEIVKPTKVDRVKSAIIAATVFPTRSNKGLLHEVDYALRLMEVKI